MHNDSRGTHATLKVSKGFLWGEEVIILVLEVIKLEIACSIHPKQLISCRQKQSGEKGRKGAKWRKEKLAKKSFAQKREKDKTRGKQGKIMLISTLKFFHSVTKCSANGIHLFPPMCIVMLLFCYEWQYLKTVADVSTWIKMMSLG